MQHSGKTSKGWYQENTCPPRTRSVLRRLLKALARRPERLASRPRARPGSALGSPENRPCHLADRARELLET